MLAEEELDLTVSALAPSPDGHSPSVEIFAAAPPRR